MKLNKAELGLGGGSFLQLANRTPIQMMSYLIDTPEGDVIMIDGGNFCPEDAGNLYSLLDKRGKCVKYWFITHSHSDHLGALAYMLENESFSDIKIENLCFNFPDLDWHRRKEPKDSAFTDKLLSLAADRKIKTVTPRANDIFSAGGVSVEVLNDPFISEDFPTANPTGIVLKVHFPKNDVLFLGDIDVWCEDMFAEKYGTEKLRCDIVQMAHHGQNAVTKKFYEYIMPSHCLYCAPKWLWENNCYGSDNPETEGKGPFTTLETRRWMDELGAVASYTHADGDWLFV